MTLGKIYYLAVLLGRIDFLAPFFTIASLGITTLETAFYLSDKERTGKEDSGSKKAIKILSVTSCLLLIISIVTPSKEDFLFISLTKDYTPQQIYKMTKEEMKSSVDYLIKQIKEIKQ